MKHKMLGTILIVFAVFMFAFDAYYIRLWLLTHQGEPVSFFPILTNIGFGIFYLGMMLLRRRQDSGTTLD